MLLRQHVTMYCCFQACDTLLTLAAISLVVLFTVTSCTPPLLTMSRALQAATLGIHHAGSHLSKCMSLHCDDASYTLNTAQTS
jgi:hypothetical protein